VLIFYAHQKVLNFILLTQKKKLVEIFSFEKISAMLCNSILCRLSKIPLSSFFFLIMCCAGIKKNYADPISLHIQKGKNPEIRKR
jgi:hypothetical protein